MVPHTHLNQPSDGGVTGSGRHGGQGGESEDTTRRVEKSKEVIAGGRAETAMDAQSGCTRMMSSSQC